MRRQHRRARRSERLVGEVETWASRIGVKPEIVYVQPMRKKWASCSSAGRIYFSSDLASEPRHFRDVVIVHELLHLRLQNHGKLFKSLLNSFVPGWENEIGGKASRICR
jgi:predicted metal-dependent hydrolase